MNPSHLDPIIEIITAEPAAEVRAGIEAALGRFNAEARGFAAEEPDFAVVVRDAATNAVLGGLYGSDGYGWAFVRLLVVPAGHRGRGLGTRLMQEAEAIARARGYVGIWLDTFEFQARPFYEKLGFELFGMLEGGDGAVPRYFLKKRF